MTYETVVDVSWWQGVIDFIKMKLKASAVIIRAGSVNSVTGNLYTDYNLAWNAGEAQEAGLRKGFYWFYREFGIEHAKRQARYFWDLVDGWTIEEGLFLDVETHNSQAASIKAFIEELQSISGLPDDKIGIYSRALLWNQVGIKALWMRRFKCWVARYANVTHPWKTSTGQVIEYLRMQPWLEPDYWQHSADGNGRGAEFGVSSDDIDINRKYIYEDVEVPEEPANELPPNALELLYNEARRRGWEI